MTDIIKCNYELQVLYAIIVEFSGVYNWGNSSSLSGE